MAILIGLSGGSGSGKTYVSSALLSFLNGRCNVISFDNYYKDQSHLPPKERDRLNYDDPKMLDMELFISHLKEIKKGNKIDVPQYDFHSHTRKLETIEFTPEEIVIVEGIMVLLCPEDLFDLKVFVDADADIRLARRIIRDVAERGRNPYSVIHQYVRTVKPMHEKYVEPTKAKADFIFKNNSVDGLNTREMAALIEQIKKLL